MKLEKRCQILALDCGKENFLGFCFVGNLSEVTCCEQGWPKFGAKIFSVLSVDSKGTESPPGLEDFTLEFSTPS